MSKYLGIGVAIKIYIKREKYPTKTILSKIDKKINLKNYQINEDDEKYLILNIKRDVFEQNIYELLKEEHEYCSENDKKYIESRLEEIKGKGYEELIEIAKKGIAGFSYHEGKEAKINNISYVKDELKMYCDLIWYTLDGKFSYECYFDIFEYMRNHIIRSLKNPLKGAIFITK